MSVLPLPVFGRFDVCITVFHYILSAEWEWENGLRMTWAMWGDIHTQGRGINSDMNIKQVSIPIYRMS